MENKYLKKTPMVNYDAAPIRNLIESRGWENLDTFDRIGAIYDYVRNEILFGYNRSDTLTAEEVLADGYGQCNTKATLLMALFRGCGIPCRLHGSEVSKCFQRGATSGIISILAPKTIAHTWVEVFYDGKWIALEGVITDEAYVQGVKKKENPKKGLFQKYAISVPDLTTLDLTWRGQDLFVQNASMVKDYGVFDDPDTFFTLHKQTWSKIKDFAYVHYGRTGTWRTETEEHCVMEKVEIPNDFSWKKWKKLRKNHGKSGNSDCFCIEKVAISLYNHYIGVMPICLRDT